MARRSLSLSVSLACLIPGNLWALCGVPQRRLICAEAANSSAVVVARLVERKLAPSDTDADLNIFTLQKSTLLRGQIPDVFIVHENNDSGRSDLEWKVGRTYLLFVSYSKTEDAYVVYLCGNSGFVNKSAKVLHQVNSLNSSHAQPTISGLVSTGNWNEGISGAEVIASGEGRMFKTLTNSHGNFNFRVDPGTYIVSVNNTKYRFAPGLLTYENPASISLQDGSCAQVHFEGSLLK